MERFGPVCINYHYRDGSINGVEIFAWYGDNTRRERDYSTATWVVSPCTEDDEYGT